MELGLGLGAPLPLLIGVDVAGAEIVLLLKSSPHDDDFTIPDAAELCLGGWGERVCWTEGGREAKLGWPVFER